MAELTKLEKVVDELFYASELAHADARCDHDFAEMFARRAQPFLKDLKTQVVLIRVKRDDGRCRSCKGDAKVCYRRHIEGKSCA